jgi:hypothetical protein
VGEASGKVKESGAHPNGAAPVKVWRCFRSVAALRWSSPAKVWPVKGAGGMAAASTLAVRLRLTLVIDGRSYGSEG